MQMQNADSRLFNWTVSPFPSLRANRKQGDRGVLGDMSDISSNQSDIQANRSADFHYAEKSYFTVSNW